MRISFHGGLCCGVKHIHELGSVPDAITGPLEAREWVGPEWSHDKQMNPDTWGMNVSSETNCFYEEAPKETYLERLDRYLAFLKGWRPSGIVEIVLCDYSETSDCNQIPAWEPLLLERGFQLITPGGVYNSNSENRVYVYYLMTGQGDE